MIIWVETLDNEKVGIEINLQHFAESTESRWTSDVSDRIPLLIIFSDQESIYRIEKDSRITTSDDVILAQFFDNLVISESEAQRAKASGVESDESGTSFNEVNPYDPDQIRVDNRSFTIHHIVSLINSGEIDLSPDFQRHFVWKEIWKKSSLIESIMLRIPLPVFYFSQDNDGLFQVVDGLQRLTVIRDFLMDKFPLKHLEYLINCESKYYSQLDPKYKRRIEQAMLSINIIDPQTPSSVKFEIFKRINQGGKTLNGQEIRNCMAKPKARSFLNDLAISEPFLRATDHTVKGLRMEDQELVLRFVGYYYLTYNKNRGLKYRGDMNLFLNEALDLLNKEKDQVLVEIKLLFTRSMNNATYLFGRYAFRKCYNRHLTNVARRQLINKSLFSVWSILLADYETEKIIQLNSPNCLNKPLADALESDPLYEQSLTVGTNVISRINHSISVAKSIIDKHLIV